MLSRCAPKTRRLGLGPRLALGALFALALAATSGCAVDADADTAHDDYRDDSATLRVAADDRHDVDHDLTRRELTQILDEVESEIEGPALDERL